MFDKKLQVGSSGQNQFLMPEHIVSVYSTTWYIDMYNFEFIGHTFDHQSSD